MTKRLFILFSLFLLVACSTPDATSVPEVAEAEPTNTAVSTDTPEPTETATEAPSNTPAPTNTAEPTDTPIPTETLTEVPTETVEPTETAVPTSTSEPLPTNTAVPVVTNPPPPASLPAVGSPPIGPNLVVNPGFEYGLDGWRNPTNPSMLFTTDAYPQFVHSGTTALRTHGAQHILLENFQPGKTYRLGAWLKIWASNNENREVSENPGDYQGGICISDEGAHEAYCSGHFRPIDTWQYITVDAVLTSNRVVISLSGWGGNTNPNLHAEIMWDDVEFGLSPVVATATPLPPGRPAPPAPVAFDAVAMRDSMNNSRSAIEQMGGLLDRIYNGSSETCKEYDGYYRAVVASPRYDGVPTEWQAVYNEYIGAVEHASNTNLPIFDLCFEHGGGGITELNYGAARQGINDSLNRLIPAIETANTMLGQ